MRIILSEEEYFERLGSILKRDFFPSLQEEFSEPERLSISEFQRLYTTEDNASFEELLSRENARKRRKFERIYGGPPELVDDPSRRLLLKDSTVDEWKYKRKPEEKNLLTSLKHGNIIGNDHNTPQINLQNTRFPGKDNQLISGKSKSFMIPPSPAREQLAHSLTTTTAKVTTKSKSSMTPKVPNYSLNDLKALTPKRSNKK